MIVSGVSKRTVTSGERRLLACAGEVARGAVGDRAGLHLDERLPIAQTRIERAGFMEQWRHRQRTGKAGRARQRQFEFECDQHGRLDSRSSGGAG